MTTKSFKHDVVTLMELVESRPCLWDRTHKEYKNKTLRDIKWREVCGCLDESYNVLNREEKKKTVQVVIQKWNNLRDAFIRSLNVKSGQTARRTYVFYENMKFLLDSKKGETDPLVSNESTHSDLNHTPERLKIHKRKLDTYDPLEKEILNKIREINQTTNSAKDEDSNFFTSFQPYIKDMSESEKLQLQMDILSSIRRIKQNRIQINESNNQEV